MSPSWNRLRNAALATLTGVAVAGTTLLVPTDSWAAGRTASATTTKPVYTAGTGRAATLATGERVEIMRAGASGPNFRITRKAGQTTGRYAFTSTNGALRVQPLNQRQVVRATELATA